MWALSGLGEQWPEAWGWLVLWARAPLPREGRDWAS